MHALAAAQGPTPGCDDGGANPAAQADALIARGVIERLLAQGEARFSNSMIEVSWRQPEHDWPYLDELESPCRLHDLVASYVVQHDSTIPHSALQGQVPDEMYFGTGAAVPEELARSRAAARQARLEANRARRCATCAQEGPLRSRIPGPEACPDTPWCDGTGGAARAEGGGTHPEPASDAVPRPPRRGLVGDVRFRLTISRAGHHDQWAAQTAVVVRAPISTDYAPLLAPHSHARVIASKAISDPFMAKWARRVMLFTPATQLQAETGQPRIAPAINPTEKIASNTISATDSDRAHTPRRSNPATSTSSTAATRDASPMKS